MTAHERKPFQNLANEAKNGSKNAMPAERYTTQGISYSQIDKERQDKEKEESNMKKHIQQIVQESYLKNSKSHSMHCN